MLHVPRSLWLAAFLVVAIHAGVLAIGRGTGPVETKLPTRPLDELPKQLGAWEGRPVELDAQVFQLLEARGVVNRAYRDPLGHQILLHVAMWPSKGMLLPHEPRMCYQGAGYEIMATKDFPIADDPSSEATSPHLMVLERGSERVYALCWYQWGPWSVADRDDMRRALWQMRNQRPCPPLIKVLLQVNGPKAEEAEEQLRSLAQPLLKWLRDYH